MSIDQTLLVIQSLDPYAKVAWSDYTRKFYIDSNISISDGCIMSGMTEHRDTREDAISAFYVRLLATPDDKFIVSKYKDKRREYRWNGAAFAECTRDIAL